MSNDTSSTRKIKTQTSRLAGRMAQGLTKRKRRFVTEMIYGIQASKDLSADRLRSG